ncbi:MAG: hypothetical protein AW12_00265 [Candidatus Accumulibacter sp. BA-94]|uniref:hypothetical protein n=1 Tax=Accumulibacter sp. TaxID=2053492 RepID=UPI00044538CE|nr:hypothetical protein [Accumulibacter sp.]EXI92785.1 MAG: hypothetical protein AW12_00265 [Candidatus Accumulibacter sp. BA-94]HRD86647.1 hypothetical protein [Accumulibacter sp.]
MFEAKSVSRSDIERHIYGTYIYLRVGMGVIAVAFPVLLYAWGAAHGIPLADSMSAYYWETLEKGSPVRVWFIGGLFAIGACLFLYQGFTKGENYALNLAGLLAIGVAYFPMEWNCGSNCKSFSMHGFCAVSMFVCLAYVTWVRSKDTLSHIKDAVLKNRYANAYNAISIVMLAAPIAAALLLVVFQQKGAYAFFLEASGIWAFAAFWFTKTAELRSSSLDAPAVPPNP